MGEERWSSFSGHKEWWKAFSAQLEGQKQTFSVCSEGRALVSAVQAWDASAGKASCLHSPSLQRSSVQAFLLKICVLNSCCSVSCAQNGAPQSALSDAFLLLEAVEKPVVHQLSPSSLCKWELCQAVVFHRNVGISPWFPLSSSGLPLEHWGSCEQGLFLVLGWDNGAASTAGSPGPCSSSCNSVASFKDLFLIEFFSFLCLTIHLLFLVLSQGCVRLCSEQYSWMVLQETFFLLHLCFILSLCHLFVL